MSDTIHTQVQKGNVVHISKSPSIYGSSYARRNAWNKIHALTKTTFEKSRAKPN